MKCIENFALSYRFPTCMKFKISFKGMYILAIRVQLLNNIIGKMAYRSVLFNLKNSYFFNESYSILSLKSLHCHKMLHSLSYAILHINL